MRLQLRPATHLDGPAVERLVFGVLGEFGLTPDPATTDADLRTIESFYAGGLFDVVVTEEGEIVGSVGLRRVNEHECELRKMYLARSVRGAGWGKRLLDHALSRAKELGFKRVTLETASVLRDAIALYERNGFKPCTPDHPIAARCDAVYALDL